MSSSGAADTPTPDVLGLGGTLPGPGWAVLDAARDRRFTGEVVAEADVTVRVYFDRGHIYVAERAIDPPLGTRLVDAGAINQAQLDYGAVRVGDTDHLGRLFDRVPSINRDGVLVINELMTEECVRWLAIQEVRAVTATPYRQHPSGMHRWSEYDATVTASSRQMLAFPAPPPGSTPVVSPDAAPAPTPAAPATVADRFDDLVVWDEPSSLGDFARAHPTESTTDRTDLWADPPSSAPAPTDVVHPADADPARPLDQFELIWPSGETNDVADSTTNGIAHDPVTSTHDDQRDGSETEQPSPLAVRRAIATIDTGSLDARRRLVGAAGDSTTPPGRLVVHREEGVWRAPESSAVRSVFDEQPTPPIDPAATESSSPGDTGAHDGRSNALRRLIDSLRRE